MRARLYAPSVIFALAGIAAAVLSVIVMVHSVRRLSSPPREVAASPQAPAKNLSPSLYCVFYDILHNGIVVGFDFAVALPKGASPRFDEKAEGTRDGTQTTFDADQRPTWAYAYDDGTPTITSPDGATRILLYGLKPEIGGVLFIEAGLRSNNYRNLDGQCRQANFGGTRDDILNSAPGKRE